ncbi:MAG: TIGR04282 family arsenosugar biosynthesis glycosyltransferase [Salibacteraceae bacterium]
MTSNDRLIIFARNADHSQVKKHLESALGAEQATIAFHKMQLYTKEVCKRLNCQKAVYYSEHIDNNDLWDNMIFDKYLQTGGDHIERMQNAFAQAFADGMNRVVIIGTHCLELETYMIKEAFAVLENNDVVLGPSRNGGYYLLGMSKFFPTLFENKSWTSKDLLMDTILDLKRMNSRYYLMKTLRTISNADDLNQLDKIQEKPEDWF